MQVELYEFTANAITYRYTSGSEAVVKGGQTFAAVAIGRKSSGSSFIR